MIECLVLVKLYKMKLVDNNVSFTVKKDEVEDLDEFKKQI